MSLNIYRRREDVPKGMKIIDCNDGYFKKIKLTDTPFTRKVISVIDGGSYVDSSQFLDRSKTGVNIYLDCLSTGSKTLLNIYYSSDKCFNVMECGNNARCLLPQIKDGNILWECISVLPLEDEACDIVFDGKSFNSFFEFLKYTEEVTYE